MIGLGLTVGVVVAAFATPAEAQFPILIVGGFAVGLLVGLWTKTYRRGALGGFLSAFVGALIGVTAAFALSIVPQTGATGFGIVFWAAFGILLGAAFGLLSGLVAAAGGAAGAFLARRREPTPAPLERKPK